VSFRPCGAVGSSAAIPLNSSNEKKENNYIIREQCSPFSHENWAPHVGPTIGSAPNVRGGGSMYVLPNKNNDKVQLYLEKSEILKFVFNLVK